MSLAGGLVANSFFSAPLLPHNRITLLTGRGVFAADEGFGGRALGRWRRGSASRIVELLPGTRTEIPTSRKRAELDGGYTRGKFESWYDSEKVTLFSPVKST